MNYHDITTDDMLNGNGLRVVLWVSGCTVNCKNCQNPQTWDFNSGIPFTEESMNEIIDKLNKPYITGLTLTGGHPLESANLSTIKTIVKTVKSRFPNKTIWLYTGFTWEEIKEYYVLFWDIISNVDVLVDGRYVDELRDITLPFRGSSNQRIIDVQQSLKADNIVLWQPK